MGNPPFEDVSPLKDGGFPLHDAGEPFVGEKTLRHRISERCAHCGRSMSLFTARVFLYELKSSMIYVCIYIYMYIVSSYYVENTADYS